MTELRIDSFNMPSCRFGGENPLPPLVSRRNASTHSRARYHGEENSYVTAEDQFSLPYLPQDQYDRSLDPRNFKTAVLENQFLRVEFLLELGGRMWSLFDKTKQRELLFKNPVFRPANLACRDAWFSGGVEWNVSLIAHTPFTCSPLFAARVSAADGTPVLRLYEWDRIRGVPWQIDFYLPEDSRFLFVRPRIINPWDRDLPMYWWSNIAVDEKDDVRVLGPAKDAVRHNYEGGLVSHPLPIVKGIDVTYPAKRPHASDLYFNIHMPRRAWVSSVDGSGYGLVHSSTDRMRGRKIFNWGTAPGGRHWQEFLSLPGYGYIELQGGLCPTQGEYMRMPPKARWDWLEAYGPIQTDPSRTHGKDWDEATGELESQLEKLLPREQAEQIYRQTQELPDRVPAEILHSGSGWGALERRRREKTGEPLPAPEALPFPDSTLGAEQQPWIELLQTGALPRRSPAELPLSPIIQREWRDLVEASVKTPKGDHWLSWYQLGIMRFGAGDIEGARKAWQTSVDRAASAWALRNLAVLATSDDKTGAAADLLGRAWKLQPTLLPLTIEYARALASANRQAEALAFIGSLSEGLRSVPRIRLIRAQAALVCNDLATVADFFEHPIDISNMREQEVSLSDLWFDYHEKRVAAAEKSPIDDALKARVRRGNPPPKWVDFRTSVSTD